MQSPHPHPNNDANNYGTQTASQPLQTQGNQIEIESDGPASAGIMNQDSAGSLSRPALLPPQGLEELAALDSLKIKQELEMFEMFGLETRNRYSIRNKEGHRVFYAAEQTKFFNRCCAGKDRPFTIKVFNSKSKLVMKIQRKCTCTLCWWGGRFGGNHLTVKSAITDELFGEVIQNFSCCTPNFDIVNTKGQRIMKIKGPCCSSWCKCLMCCSVEFDIYLTSGSQYQYIGKIKKVFALKEAVGDANNFTLSFPVELDLRVKACLIAAGFSLDYAFFETHALHHGCCNQVSWCVICTIIVIFVIGITFIVVFIYSTVSD